jgi:hypothetical protein
MKNPRHPLLIGGICLLGAGLAGYFVDAIAAPRHWLVLAGAMAVLFYFVLGRVARVPADRKPESMLYEEGNTTMLDDMKDPKDRRGG